MVDWGFWAVALALVAAVAAILAGALRRDRQLAAPAAQDLRVYKDQLAEVDRDLARGTIAADEAQRLRTEVGRRLLEADRSLAAVGPVQGRSMAGLAGALMLVALIGAVGVYWRLGAPGYPDLPLAYRLALSDEILQTRPPQAEAVAAAPVAEVPDDIDPDFLELMEKLRTAVAERPGDLQGLELLSRNEAALGDFAAAEAAQRRIIAVKGEAASGADHAALAEIMIAAAGGYVSPEAEAELVAALQREPGNPTARYFSGLMFSQAGRFDRTFALWQPLLDEGPDDAPWVVAIRAQIEDVAFRAGVNYEMPAASGPSTGDIAAAGEMSADERQEMIEGMVAQLSDRLADEGGTVEDWNRLIRSLVVLERTEEAQTIYDEAKTRFAGRDAELSFLRLAAVETGLQP